MAPQKIKLTKIADVGEKGCRQVPVGYEIEGYPQNELKVDKIFLVMITRKNDRDCSGLFSSSRVTEITENQFKTNSSIFEIQKI
jgi:hypothetical protein